MLNGNVLKNLSPMPNLFPFTSLIVLGHLHFPVYWTMSSNSNNRRPFFITTDIFILWYVVSSDVGRKISQPRARVEHTHAWIGTWFLQRLPSTAILPVKLMYFVDDDRDVDVGEKDIRLLIHVGAYFDTYFDQMGFTGHYVRVRGLYFSPSLYRTPVSLKILPLPPQIQSHWII